VAQPKRTRNINSAQLTVSVAKPASSRFTIRSRSGLKSSLSQCINLTCLALPCLALT
jgi:hypothetical protein